MFKPRHLFIRFLTPLVWRLSTARKIAALQEFSDTELDSGWQSLQAMDHLTDPRSRALLFDHCQEEFRHADLFARLRRQYETGPQIRSVFSRKALIDREAGRAALLDFMAEVYVGEKRINEDFVAYASANLDQPIRSVFQRIKADEEGHEADSWQLMVEHAEGREAAVRWLVARKHLAYGYRRWVKLGEAMGNRALTVVLGLVYAATGLFFVRHLRGRIALDRSAQLEIFRAQVAHAHAREHGGRAP